jgi:hypothetical protein
MTTFALAALALRWLIAVSIRRALLSGGGFGGGRA